MRHSVPITAYLSKDTVMGFLWLKYLKVESQLQESATKAFSIIDLCLPNYRLKFQEQEKVKQFLNI